MDIYTKTVYGDKNGAACLICKTTYHNGQRTWPQPSCACGNVPFFDITPAYVRFAIQWPLVLVSSADNWETEILEQIKRFGKPNQFKNIPDKTNNFSLNYYLNKYSE